MRPNLSWARNQAVGKLFALIITFSITFAPVATVYAADPPPPSAPGQSVLTAEGGLRSKVDSTTGAFTQSIPIDMPPGRNGLQPDLSLNYNSQNTDQESLVGYGWSLSIPYISRLNKTGTEDLYNQSAYFTSTMDGELGQTSATNTYRARVDEGAFNLYTYSTSTNMWTMYTKNGTRYLFGSTTQAQQSATTSPTNVYKWMLEEIRDTNDNFVRFAYAKDGNQIYPYKIYYTGSGSTDGLGVITFATTSRPDTINSYKTGFKVWTNHRITQITVAFNGTNVRQYNLSYTTGNNGYRSLLSGVQHSGWDEAGSLTLMPTTTFSYMSSTTAFVWPGAITVKGSAWVVTELNGNGRPDHAAFVTGWNGYVNADNNGSASTVTAPDYWSGSCGCPQTYTPWERGVRLMDINGDGRADVVTSFYNYTTGTTTQTLSMNTYSTSTYYSWAGTSTISGSIPAISEDGSGSRHYMTLGLFGDFNGTGLSSFAQRVDGYYPAASYLGNGSAWDSTSTVFLAPKSLPDTFTPTETNSQLIDINGDSLSDWLYSASGYTYVLLNNGRGWDTVPASEWTIATTTLYKSTSPGNTYYDRGIRFVDINGDGLPDLLHSYTMPSYVTNSADKPEVATYSQVFLNTGKGWATSTAYTLPAYIVTGQLSGTDWQGTYAYNEYVNWLGSGQQYQDVISTVANPYGGTTDITYGYTAQSRVNEELPYSLLVVTKMVNHDGLGSNETTDYAYGGGKQFLSPFVFDRRFGGFYTITATTSNSVITRYFNQGDWPTSNAGEQTDGYSQIEHPFREDVMDTQNHPIRRTYFRWDTDNSTTTEVSALNLAGYWKFEEASGPAGDSSVNGNTLTNNNGATSAAGKINTATSLARGSNQYFTRSDNASLSVTGNLTVSMWVKFASTPSLNNQYKLISKSDGTAAGESYLLTLLNDAGTLNLYGQVRQNSTTYTAIERSWTPTAGTWYHVAFVYDASSTSLTLYVNGSQLGSQVTSAVSSIQDTSATFYVGGSSVGAVEADDGLIDELELWSRALSSTEVSTLYQLGAQNPNFTLIHLGMKVTADFNSDSSHLDKAVGYIYATSTQNLIRINDYGQVVANSDGTFTDSGSDGRSTIISYAASTAVNMFVPTQQTLLNANSSTTTYSRFYYDNLSFGSVGKGNQTKIENWIAGSLYASSTKTYTTYGLVATSADPLSHTTAFVYDSFNMYPATTTNALNQSTGNVYNYSNGKPKSTYDPNGMLTKNTYDGLGRILQTSRSNVTTPSTLDLVTSLVYTDSTTTLSSVRKTDYMTSTTSADTYEYFDGLNRLIQQRRSTENAASSSVSDRTYNGDGVLSTQSLPYFSLGTARTSATTTSNLYTSYTYDALKRQTVIGTIVGNTTISYGGWTATTTDANSHSKAQVIDAYGNLSQVNEVNGVSTYSTVYSYDVANNLTRITDASGNIRNFTYDGLNRRLTAQDLHAPSNVSFGTWNYAYDLAGNIASTTDPKSQRVDYTYDGLNRPLTEDYTAATGTEVIYTYDSCTKGVGRLCTASSSGAQMTYVYDLWGRTLISTTTIGRIGYGTSYTYDFQGNQTSIVYPDRRTVAYFYNGAGLLSWVTTKGASDSSFSSVAGPIIYAPTRAISILPYANGINTIYTYDDTRLYRLQRILSAIGATSSATTLTAPAGANAYWKFDESSGTAADATGNGNTLTNNNTATFAAGKVNNGTSLSRASNQFFTKTDTVSLSATSSLTIAGWIKFSTTPTSNNLYKIVSKSDGTAFGESYWLMLFNDAGTMTLYGQVRANSGSGFSGIQQTWSPTTGTWYHIAMVFNNSAQTLTLYVNGVQLGSQTSGTVTSIQDATSTAYVGSSSVGSSESDDGMIDELGIWGRALSAVEISTLYSNGFGVTYGGTASSTANSLNSVTDMRYTYDAVGNITNITNVAATGTSITTAYTYDSLNRLIAASTTAADSNPFTQTYTYDALGSFTNKSDVGNYTYSSSGTQNPHAPTAVNGVSFTYDLNGNLTAASPWTYTWDYKNRLTNSNNGSASTTHQYDFQGNRMLQLTSTTTSHYPNRFYSISSTTAGSITSATSTAFIYAGDLLIGQIEQKLSNGVATGTPSTRYVHSDHLASIRALTNASGTPVETLDYYPYGSRRIASSTGSIDTKRKFIGQFTDDNALDYLNARFYQSDRGQFLSQDPVFWEIGHKLRGQSQDAFLKNPQSLNSYSYAESNPVIKSDPDGRCAGPFIVACLAVIGAGVGIAFKYAGGVLDKISQGDPNPRRYDLTFTELGTSAATGAFELAALPEKRLIGGAYAFASSLADDRASGDDPNYYKATVSSLTTVAVGSLFSGLIGKVPAAMQARSQITSQVFQNASVVLVNNTMGVGSPTWQNAQSTAKSAGIGNTGTGSFVGTYNFGTGVGIYNFGTGTWVLGSQSTLTNKK